MASSATRRSGGGMSGTGRGCTCTAATCCPSTAASQGTGSAILNWAESRIRQLVQQHGTAQTAVIGANAMASEQEATALLLETGYRRVFSLVELELADLRQLPDEEQWTFESFLATADPTCWRAAWEGESKAGGRPVLHPSARPNCGRSRRTERPGRVKASGPWAGPAAGRGAMSSRARCEDRPVVHRDRESAPILRPLRKRRVPAPERVRPLPQADRRLIRQR